MNTQECETINIPLKKLLEWDHNVRTTPAADNKINELVASITALGVLQSLVVKPAPRGKYIVVAGKRRLTALSQLADQGSINTDYPVPCRILPPDADLTEVSLAENVQREQMTVEDEFNAFKSLAENGRSVADIAVRFGVTEAVVNRRLALARVSPVLIAKHREGELTLDMLQAFTLTDDHQIQERIWNDLQPWDRNARRIREMLTGQAIEATDKRVRFVGLSNYLHDAGLVRRDLFAEGDEGTFIEDRAKLNRLVNEKLQDLGEALKAGGWKWVALQPEIDYQFIHRHRRLEGTPVPLPAKLQAKLSSLEERRNTLQQQVDSRQEDEDFDQDAAYDQLDELEGKIRHIQGQRKIEYSDQVKATTGVVVNIGQNGEPEFRYGLLRKEDEKALAYRDDDLQHETLAEPSPQQDESSGYSAALIESLTQHKTAAIAFELAGKPAIALAAVVHALVLSTFDLDLGLYRAKSCVQILLRQISLEGATNSRALSQLEADRLRWLEALPNDANGLWQWILTRDHETLLSLLAFCAARSVHGVQFKNDANPERLQHANHLASALHVEMSKWFTPTAENFFGRVPKSKIAEALEEAGKPASATQLALKKADLAAACETELVGTNWLPEPVRIALPAR